MPDETIEDYATRQIIGLLGEAAEQDAKLAKLEADNARLLAACEAITKRYVDLAASGDCGFWNPEEESEVVQARAAIEEAKR